MAAHTMDETHIQYVHKHPFAHTHTKIVDKALMHASKYHPCNVSMQTDIFQEFPVLRFGLTGREMMGEASGTWAAYIIAEQSIPYPACFFFFFLCNYLLCVYLRVDLFYSNYATCGDNVCYVKADYYNLPNPVIQKCYVPIFGFITFSTNEMFCLLWGWNSGSVEAVL